MASQLYCCNSGVADLWAINVASPGSSTKVGNFPSGLGSPNGLASHGGVLYCCNGDGDELWAINATSPGLSTKVGNFPSGLVNPFGLASHGGVLYCCDSAGDELWAINVASPGLSTNIGGFPSGLSQPLGLASHEVVLYCCDSDGDELWAINVASPGSSTNIGDFPSGLGLPEGLASHGGVLYCCDSDGDELWAINVASPGSSTKVGNFPSGLANPFGLASHEVVLSISSVVVTGVPEVDVTVDLSTAFPILIRTGVPVVGAIVQQGRTTSVTGVPTVSAFVASGLTAGVKACIVSVGEQPPPVTTSLFDQPATEPGAADDTGVRYRVTDVTGSSGYMSGITGPLYRDGTDTTVTQIYNSGIFYLDLGVDLSGAEEADLVVAYRKGSLIRQATIASADDVNEPYYWSTSELAEGAPFYTGLQSGTIDEIIIYSASVAGALPGWDDTTMSWAVTPPRLGTITGFRPETGTLEIVRRVGERPTAEFDIFFKDHEQFLRPIRGQTVQIKTPRTVLFGGTVLDSRVRLAATGGVGRCRVTCTGYAARLDRTIKARYVTDLAATTADVILDLLGKFAADSGLIWNRGTVVAPGICPPLTFGWENLSDALTLVSDAGNVSLYVDHHGVVQAHEKSYWDRFDYTRRGNGFVVTDSGVSPTVDQSEDGIDPTNFMNDVTVIGSSPQTSTLVEDFDGDGETQSWPLSYDADKLTLVELVASNDIATEVTDEEAWDLGPDRARIIQRSTDLPLADGMRVRVTYAFHLPVIDTVRDDASIEAYGLTSFVEEDPELDTLAAVNARATALVARNKTPTRVFDILLRPGVEGPFEGVGVPVMLPRYGATVCEVWLTEEVEVVELESQLLQWRLTLLCDHQSLYAQAVRRRRVTPSQPAGY